MNYILITPARNEERFIRLTLDSVTSQTRLPLRWVIVNDGSTDLTGAIADEYAARFPWITVIQRPRKDRRSFAGKVHAFNAGYETIQMLDFDVVGNLDSDISFAQDYLAFLMEKFEEDPSLGVAGTPFIENGYDSSKDSFEGENHVAGGCQMFRHQCFTEIGGYTPHSAGGIDWIAVMTARMKGWKTHSFPDKRFHHYRPLGTAERSLLASAFSYGEKDYYLGNSPIWQIFRLSYRMIKKPVFIGAVALAAGYLSAFIRQMPRAVSSKLIRFHRVEQMKKLKMILSSLLGLKKTSSSSRKTETTHTGVTPLWTEKAIIPIEKKISAVLDHFIDWLDAYGETSWDQQSYFAGNFGQRAKALYYQQPWTGSVVVAPMILSEAFLPGLRQWFHHRTRFPIADAHYAMGFAFLYQVNRRPDFLNRAIHFLNKLKKSRCPDFKEYCWGYPFDWVTRKGVMKQNTPLITSTPYGYEAFLHLYQIAPCDEWLDVLASITRHVRVDIKDFPVSKRGNSCSYSPFDKGEVVNAAAYRAAMMSQAYRLFGNEEDLKIAERNLCFVLESQNEDGSWPYAVDGVRNFVDHFHTCFVLKAVAKIHSITGHKETLIAMRRGVAYYLGHLFTKNGLPQPFSVQPRLTVYKHELYDYAECINLCLLLRDRFPDLQKTLDTVIESFLRDWVKPDGSFRSRELLFGWDNVPMHRWAQSQMFRSLACYLYSMNV